MGGKALGLHHLWNGHVWVVPRDPRPAGSKDPSRNPRAQTSYTKKLGTGGPRGSSEPLGSRPHVCPGLRPQPQRPTSASASTGGLRGRLRNKSQVTHQPCPPPHTAGPPVAVSSLLASTSCPVRLTPDLIRSAKGNATGPQSEGAQSAPAVSSAQPPSAVLFSQSSSRVWRPVPPRSPHLLSQGWGCSTQHMDRLQGSPEEMAQPQGPEPQCPK